jgi:hypothetical protein
VLFALKAPLKALGQLAVGTLALVSLAALAVLVAKPWVQLFLSCAAWLLLSIYLYLATVERSAFWRWMLNAALGSVVGLGPLLATGGSMAYLIAKNTESYERRFAETIASVPGTPYYAPDRARPQTIEVMKVLGRAPDDPQRAADESASYTIQPYRPALAQAFLMVGAPLRYCRCLL